MIKLWRVHGRVEASTYIGEYQAETAERAIELAWRDAGVSVCHQCGEHISDPEVAELFAEEDYESDD